MNSIRLYRIRQRKKIVPVFLLAAFAWVLAGCATRADVVEVVSATNLAMVTPGLSQSGKAGGDAWKEPVEKIDKIISEHADEKKLVAALRLRQAMLLTVHGKNNLANAAFGLVNETDLHSERDKALFNLRKEITWWYRRAPKVQPFSKNERDKAKKSLKAFSDRCNKLKKGSDIRLYLETMRALMAVRVANDSPAQQEKSKQAVTELMIDALKRYVDAFDVEDHKWLKKNFLHTEFSEELPLARLRARVELRMTVRRYFKVARDRKFQPDWGLLWMQELFNLFLAET